MGCEVLGFIGRLSLERKGLFWQSAAAWFVLEFGISELESLQRSGIVICVLCWLWKPLTPHSCVRVGPVQTPVHPGTLNIEPG